MNWKTFHRFRVLMISRLLWYLLCDFCANFRFFSFSKFVASSRYNVPLFQIVFNFKHVSLQKFTYVKSSILSVDVKYSTKYQSVKNLFSTIRTFSTIFIIQSKWYTYGTSVCGNIRENVYSNSPFTLIVVIAQRATCYDLRTIQMFLPENSRVLFSLLCI